MNCHFISAHRSGPSRALRMQMRRCIYLSRIRSVSAVHQRTLGLIKARCVSIRALSPLIPIVSAMTTDEARGCLSPGPPLLFLAVFPSSADIGHKRETFPSFPLGSIYCFPGRLFFSHDYNGFDLVISSFSFSTLPSFFSLPLALSLDSPFFFSSAFAFAFLPSTSSAHSRHPASACTVLARTALCLLPYRGLHHTAHRHTNLLECHLPARLDSQCVSARRECFPSQATLGP